MRGKARNRAVPEVGTVSQSSAGGYLRLMAKQKYLILMVLPGLAVILLFRYLPMYGILIAFKDYSIGREIWSSPWVGLKWFEHFFSNPLSWRLFRNTFLLGLWSLIVDFPDSIILALLLNEVRKTFFKRSVQSITYLPHFISFVIMVGILKELTALDGGFNRVIQFFGGEPIHFFARPEWFRPLFVLSNVWRSIGWGTIIYLATMSRINPEIYESATIDGASRIQKMVYVTLPGISDVIVILLILSVGSFLSGGFEQVLVMQNASVMEVSDVLGTFVYRTGLLNSRYSYAAAAGLFRSIVATFLVAGANYTAKRLGREGIV